MNSQSDILAFESHSLEIVIRYFVRDLHEGSNSLQPQQMQCLIRLTKGSYSSSINMNSASVRSFLASSAA